MPAGRSVLRAAVVQRNIPYGEICKALQGASDKRKTNISYMAIVGGLVDLARKEEEARDHQDLDAHDDQLAYIEKFENQIPGVHSKKVGQNQTLVVLEGQLTDKKHEINRARFGCLADAFRNRDGRIVYRGDGRGPAAFGLDVVPQEHDPTVFDIRDPGGEQTIEQVGASVNMVSTTSVHNLPTRYFGKARAERDKASAFNFTIYALYLPAGSAILVAEYLRHRWQRHHDGRAVGVMTGQDNIGSEELVSGVSITRGNVLGYRVIEELSTGVKHPGEYVDVNKWSEGSYRAPEVDAQQLKKFRDAKDLTHTGRM